MYQRILYTSRATNQISLRNVYDIIHTAHSHNNTLGITGALLFIDGYFIQMLEGLPIAVRTRFARIQRDRRHYDIKVRIDEQTTSLAFPLEFMALRAGAEIDPDVLREHRYEPGLPADRYDGEQIKSFMVSCFAEPVLA